MKLLGKFWRRNHTWIHVLWIDVPYWSIGSMLQKNRHHNTDTDIPIQTNSSDEPKNNYQNKRNQSTINRSIKTSIGWAKTCSVLQFFNVNNLAMLSSRKAYQNFQNFVQKKCRTCISACLNILCLICKIFTTPKIMLNSTVMHGFFDSIFIYWEVQKTSWTFACIIQPSG